MTIENLTSEQREAWLRYWILEWSRTALMLRSQWVLEQVVNKTDDEEIAFMYSIAQGLLDESSKLAAESKRIHQENNLDRYFPWFGKEEELSLSELAEANKRGKELIVKMTESTSFH